ncbi:MAG: cysteine hydrolase [Firmicutes bacterium]|nr:cysteine hydrolase [Bacillota bacterium]
MPEENPTRVRSRADRALVVIDMLNDFVAEGGALFCGPASRAIIPFVAERVARARVEGIPVVYVMDRHLPDDSEFEMFPAHCVVGTKGAEVCPELDPKAGDVLVPKRRYSAFFGTDLDLHLRELGVKGLELVGVCTNICIFFTAADARMLGYRVTVPRAGVASFDAAAHEFALGQMEKVLGARVV